MSAPPENTHTNRLIDETSPYLLQHAHNPVAWFPWGEEALEKSRDEDKPILLSVGYSACHWCHVMERESFENDDIAALMNEHFIPIKVDREERPDIDEIYMNAVQMMTGSGGWPLTVFPNPSVEAFLRWHLLPARRSVRAARIQGGVDGARSRLPAGARSYSRSVGSADRPVANTLVHDPELRDPDPRCHRPRRAGARGSIRCARGWLLTGAQVPAIRIAFTSAAPLSHQPRS